MAGPNIWTAVRTSLSTTPVGKPSAGQKVMGSGAATKPAKPLIQATFEQLRRRQRAVEESPDQPAKRRRTGEGSATTPIKLSSDSSPDVVFIREVKAASRGGSGAANGGMSSTGGRGPKPGVATTMQVASGAAADVAGGALAQMPLVHERRCTSGTMLLIEGWNRPIMSLCCSTLPVLGSHRWSRQSRTTSSSRR